MKKQHKYNIKTILQKNENGSFSMIKEITEIKDKLIHPNTGEILFEGDEVEAAMQHIRELKWLFGESLINNKEQLDEIEADPTVVSFEIDAHSESPIGTLVAVKFCDDTGMAIYTELY